MKKTEAIRNLKMLAPAMKGRGIAALYIFGSLVNGSATKDSDIDLFVDVTPQQKFSILDLIFVKQFLEDELGYPVDLMTRGSIHPVLRQDIEQEAVRVF